LRAVRPQPSYSRIEPGRYRQRHGKRRDRELYLPEGYRRPGLELPVREAREQVPKTIHLRDALVYTGTHLFRARERKDEIVGTIAEPRKDALWRMILRTG
jgi:hypothetical protein